MLLNVKNVLVHTIQTALQLFEHLVQGVEYFQKLVVLALYEFFVFIIHKEVYHIKSFSFNMYILFNLFIFWLNRRILSISVNLIEAVVREEPLHLRG